VVEWQQFRDLSKDFQQFILGSVDDLCQKFIVDDPEHKFEVPDGQTDSQDSVLLVEAELGNVIQNVALDITLLVKIVLLDVDHNF